VIANRDKIVQDIYSIAVDTSTLSQQTGETKRGTTLSIPYFEICCTYVKLCMCQRLHNLWIVLRKYLPGMSSHSRVLNGRGGNICYFLSLYSVWCLWCTCCVIWEMSILL